MDHQDHTALLDYLTEQTTRLNSIMRTPTSIGVREGGLGKVTPSQLTSTLVVSIQRNPALDEAAVALSSKKVCLEIQSCFLCGEASLTLTQGRRRRHYLRQIQLFKTLSQVEDDEGGVETCANCLQEVTTVWALTQQIHAIREELDKIVKKLVKANKVSKDGQGARRSGEVKESSDGDLPDITSPDQYFEDTLDTIFVELKEEIPWSEDELVDNEAKEVDKMLVEEHLLGDVKPVPIHDDLDLDLPGTPPISIRHSKRKRKLARDDGDPLGFSDPEESNSEENSESDSSKSPPKKNIVCPHCKKPYADRHGLMIHIRLVHLGYDRPPHKCPQCQKTYSKRNGLAQHVKSVHQKETFPCSFCAKKLSSQKQCAIHEATICKVPEWTEVRLKKEFDVSLVSCRFAGCGKLYDSKRPFDMKRHLAIHHKL